MSLAKQEKDIPSSGRTTGFEVRMWYRRQPRVCPLNLARVREMSLCWPWLSPSLESRIGSGVSEGCSSSWYWGCHCWSPRQHIWDQAASRGFQFDGEMLLSISGDEEILAGAAAIMIASPILPRETRSRKRAKGKKSASSGSLSKSRPSVGEACPHGSLL